MASPVNLLQLSPTMTDGTIVKWLVKEGDEVESGQPIAEVETDKAVMEQESFEDGTVLKIVVGEGERVPVESLLMVIGDSGEDISSLLEQSNGKKESKPAPAEPKQEAPPAEPPTPSRPEPAASADKGDGGRLLASPLARKIAEDAGLDLSRLQGSGPKGRIVKRDVEQAIEKGVPAAKPAPAAPSRPAAAPPRPAPTYEFGEAEKEIPLSGMRETIARRLVESKQNVPHFQLSVEVRGERLLEAVDRARAAFPEDKVTVTHFMIKAMAAAAMKHEPIRSQFAGNVLKVMPDASISVAVAIDAGLVTPVIRRANTKGIVQIAKELRELAGLARERKLQAEDFQGGVQTISNLGMYGITRFNAIINPPESSILAIGAMEDHPVVDNGQLVPGKVMEVTMSCDHRVIDGAVGAAYLSDLKKILEDPMLILM